MAFWLADMALKCELVGGSEKLVLAILGRHADDTSTCFLSQQALCVESGLGARTVRDCLNSLESTGLIARSPHWRKSGGRGVDRCVLNLGSKPAKSAAMNGAYRQNLHPIPAKSAAIYKEKTITEPITKEINLGKGFRALSETLGSVINEGNLSRRRGAR